ncbi:hypothetical protein [Paraeggerthella sp.]|uniref:hypothetical protein n=1 Tax=Paraeggerthella sp. TaxID=2897350 RepID=UPI0035293FCD
MGLVLFHVTLIVLLISILASAMCLSAYLVSRKRLMLFAFFAFLFYFFDVAFVFQDEFVSYVLGSEQGQIYLVIRSLTNVITGGGFLVSFWFLVCDYLGETRRALLVAPGVVFAVMSVAVLVALPEGDLQRFLFYGMRELFVFLDAAVHGVSLLLVEGRCRAQPPVEASVAVRDGGGSEHGRAVGGHDLLHAAERACDSAGPHHVFG